jgi:ABC-2 type transport system ATP-binding protein
MCHSVAIIEQGRLLATGSVEEIQRERKQHRELVFRSLSSPAKLAQALAQNPTCHNVKPQDDSVIVEFVGQPADQAELVRGLILAGHPITEVSSRLKSLEEIFLQVTEGRVQ